MYYPIKIRLQNFGPYKDSEFSFKKGSATMVYGVNNTDKGSKSNGSGKSFILEAICVAMINSPLRKASVKDLVRTGEKESIQTFELFNPILKRSLEIKRTIYSNTKSGQLEILVNGEAPKIDLTNVDDGNKFIINEIGIAREDLLNYFIISKERYEPFLKISDTKKKAIIARFSQSNLIDPAFDQLDEEKDELNSSVDSFDRQISTIDGKIEVYKEEIDNFSIEGIEIKRREEIRELSEANDRIKETLNEKK